MKSCKLKQKIIQQSLPCDIEINYLRYTLGELTKKKNWMQQLQLELKF